LFHLVDVFSRAVLFGTPLYTPGTKERVVELPGRSDVWNDNHGTRTLWQTAHFRAETVERDAWYSTSERSKEAALDGLNTSRYFAREKWWRSPCAF
jgi:hypothetical protein